MQNKPQSTGFFAALFDVSFNTFVTSKLISVLYILAIIFIVIVAIFGIGSGFLKLFDDFWAGFMRIVVTPLAALIWLVFVRITLELIIVIFKIADNTKEMVEIQHSLTPKE
jgi:hypothetical protein